MLQLAAYASRTKAMTIMWVLCSCLPTKNEVMLQPKERQHPAHGVPIHSVRASRNRSHPVCLVYYGARSHVYEGAVQGHCWLLERMPASMTSTVHAAWTPRCEGARASRDQSLCISKACTNFNSTNSAATATKHAPKYQVYKRSPENAPASYCAQPQWNSHTCCWLYMGSFGYSTRKTSHSSSCLLCFPRQVALPRRHD